MVSATALCTTLALTVAAADGQAAAARVTRPDFRAQLSPRLRASVGPKAIPAAQRRRRRRPGCGSSCRQLGGVGGTLGQCTPGADGEAVASVASATTLRFRAGDFFPARGDLVLASVEGFGPADAAVGAPPGWTPIPGADGGGSGHHLHVFYRIVTAGNENSTVTPMFTSSVSQPMYGVLVDFMGISATNSVEAAAAQLNSGQSTSVTAPSTTPTWGDSLLVFIGGAGTATSWALPPGMHAPTPPLQSSVGQRAPLVVATQRWPTATASGSRTATISDASASVGALVALNYPLPVACPRVRVLTRHFSETRDGSRLIYARMTCVWAAPCHGAFEGLDDNFRKLAASDFSIPAGATRTVPIAVTPFGQKSLQRHHKQHLAVFVWAFTAVRQPVLAGTGYWSISQ
jgi:hypothetical protein